MVELERLLSDPSVRLVTVLGAGGMGKTRLALQAAEILAEKASQDGFAHGVFFVPLAPLQSADAIVPTVAQTLGFPFYEGGEPRQQLLDYLREKRMLLLLDNYEHLLAGVDLVADILRMAPSARVLVTSRARLGVQGEQLYHLAGMDYPDWETPEDALEYTVRSSCSCRARGAPKPASSWKRTTCSTSPVFAAWWVGCRWASSWRRRGSRC